MNVRDSEVVEAQLQGQGLQPASGVEDADVVVINTCSVRDKAEQKLYSDLGRLKHWKQNGRRVVVAGCVAQQERDAITKRMPWVDLVLGTHQVRELPKHLETVARSGERVIATEWKHSDPVARLGRPDTVLPRRRASVFVTIQEGCDNVCTFCVVPFTRGREVSRPLDAVVEEVREHVDRGAREIVLLGQNVNSWGAKFDAFPSFAELLYRVHEVPGVDRIRFTSPHPKDYTEDLATAYRELPNLCPSAHLPLQAGSDRVLAAMRRGYTGARYLEIVAMLREARPDIHFSTDIIVGFPGELREDFEATLDIVREVRFAQIYAFVFSPRPMTPALRMDDPVPMADKKAWLQELFALQQTIQAEDHQEWVGRSVDVLWTD
ncbi:MAG: tRNA (N6-isopentenyl adenosine(37)-C2)-methylthiotransferase MiaB, partial [Candidatus Dadabacteria bacterium]